MIEGLAKAEGIFTYIWLNKMQCWRSLTTSSLPCSVVQFKHSGP